MVTKQGERATMTAICNEAALTERYFYESFTSRDAALVAALDAVAGEIATGATIVLNETTGTPGEQVHAMVAWFVGWASEHPSRALLAVVASEATEALRARRHELLRSFADIAAEEFEKLYGGDAWPPDRARAHGLLYVSGLAELVAAWLTGSMAIDAEQVAGTASDAFVSLGRRP